MENSTSTSWLRPTRLRKVRCRREWSRVGRQHGHARGQGVSDWLFGMITPQLQARREGDIHLGDSLRASPRTSRVSAFRQAAAAAGVGRWREHTLSDLGCSDFGCGFWVFAREASRRIKLGAPESGQITPGFFTVRVFRIARNARPGSFATPLPLFRI